MLLEIVSNNYGLKLGSFITSKMFLDLTFLNKYKY